MKKHLHKGRCEVLKRLHGNSKDRKNTAEKVKSKKSEKSGKFYTEENKTKKFELEPKVIKPNNPPSSMYQQFTTINPNEISL